jgi:hypothetical protein
MILLSLVLLVSLVVNGMLIWYSRKISEQFAFAIKNVDEYQKLLDQYLMTLSAVYELEAFYGDQELKIVIEHTKVVADACAGFKSTLIKTETKEDDNSENNQQEENPQ